MSIADFVEIHGYPSVLYIGSSHVTRLREYGRDNRTLRRHRDALINSHFLSVPGLKWATVNDQLHGNNLLEKHQHLGSQWASYYSSGFHPHFIAIILGSNDASDADIFMTEYYKLHKKNPNVRRLLQTYMDRWFEELSLEIDNFFNNLLRYIPGADIRYIPILKRESWSNYGATMADWIDHYMSGCIGRTYGIKIMKTPRLYIHRLKIKRRVGKRDVVMPGLLDYYRVHLTCWGYAVLIDNIMTSMVMKWMTHF